MLTRVVEGGRLQPNPSGGQATRMPGWCGARQTAVLHCERAKLAAASMAAGCCSIRMNEANGAPNTHNYARPADTLVLLGLSRVWETRNASYLISCIAYLRRYLSLVSVPRHSIRKRLIAGAVVEVASEVGGPLRSLMSCRTRIP